MADDSLVPKSPNRRGIDVAAVSNSVSNTEAVLKRVHDIRQNTELTFGHKRKLIKAEVASLFNARRKEIEARQKILELKLDADVNAASRAISIYRNTIITQMDDEFNKFIGALGIKVAVNRMQLLQKLGEQLDDFQRELKKSRMSKAFKQAILVQVQRTFEDMTEQIAGHISKVAVPDDDK